MQFEIKNYYLKPTYELLTKLKLKSRYSIARTKFVHLIGNKIGELQQDEMTLIEEFGKRDEFGKLIHDDKGNFEILEDNNLEWTKFHNDLLNQTAVINQATYKEHEADLKDIFYCLDYELSDIEAECFAIIADYFHIFDTETEEE